MSGLQKHRGKSGITGFCLPDPVYPQRPSAGNGLNGDSYNSFNLRCGIQTWLVPYLTPEDWPRVDELLDQLIDKNRQGYKMINSVQHLNDMKDFLRGKVEPWECRAGQNSLIIRTDGTLAPCFSLYSAKDAWGTIENPRFDLKEIDERKKTCTRKCLSTCQHTGLLLQ